MWVIESDGDTFNGMYSKWKPNPMAGGWQYANLAQASDSGFARGKGLFWDEH
jgi:hypothetical protein